MKLDPGHRIYLGTFLVGTATLVVDAYADPHDYTRWAFLLTCSHGGADGGPGAWVTPAPIPFHDAEVIDSMPPMGVLWALDQARLREVTGPVRYLHEGLLKSEALDWIVEQLVVLDRVKAHTTTMTAQ